MHGEIVLLVNPTAGRGRGARAAAPAAAALRAAGLTVRQLAGRDGPHALELAREAVRGGARALVAVGGDGMVGLALQAVAGSAVPLGVIPAGTGNDFARALRLPTADPAAAGRLAARVLGGGAGRAVDLGRVASAAGERWFGTVLACGLDSRVNDRANRMSRPGGRLRYDVALLAELAALRPIRYRLVLDGVVHDLDATLIAVGNAPSYGGGMRICPGARLDDGRFDVTVVAPCSRTRLLTVFPRVYRGTHVGHPLVSVHRAASVRLEAPDLAGYADGERIGLLPLSAEAVPGAVRVLAEG
ncbi:diacylglycerol kinase [Streptomyces sp. NPDC092296]|uniref:diacylglycerol kinase n=1 Tax=Streptomyces sp. NPDC092296 TaxID=3366012 RepID=UPI00382A281F